ncbi:MAG: IS30 family transposase [PVC group bacterium]|nr:IS30 family transposase [PVC group bacterium]
MRYIHISINEREKIALLLATGKKQNEIARELCRSKSTVSREIKRNSGKTGYRITKAQRKSDKRRRESKQPYKMTVPGIKNYVKSKLALQWSPEQIANSISKKSPNDNTLRITHETIYAWIRLDKASGGEWYKELRQSSRKRRKRYGSGTSKRGQIKNAKDIEQRPDIVDTRTRGGDWESDTIEGAKGTGYVATHVCRKSKYVVLAKLPTKAAATFNNRTAKAFNRHGDLHRHTFTFDRGKEFAAHEQFERKMECMVYFAKPYHAWQRGTNENTNGLLRQYLPKGIDFGTISNKYLKHVEKLLNTRPRKTLGYQTPYNVMKKLTGVALQI